MGNGTSADVGNCSLARYAGCSWGEHNIINSRSEVLVVGAGPVGLFAALSLAKRGVRVQVVDTGVWPCQHSYALALHPQTLALLEKLGFSTGLWQQRIRYGAWHSMTPKEDELKYTWLKNTSRVFAWSSFVRAGLKNCWKGNSAHWA